MRNKPEYLNEKSPKEKSQEQEKRIAKEGFKTPASGAFWTHKGDVKFEDYLIEAKRTDKKGIRITEKMLKKIFEEAVEEGKIAGMEIELKNYYLRGIISQKGG